MLLPKFDYSKPKTVEEVCSLLSKYKEKARVIAGGTDLLIKMKDKSLTPQYLIGLTGVTDLNYIEYKGTEGLRIGALATINSIVHSPAVKERFGYLSDAAARMATPQVRNMGTVGGNLCSAAPSADLAPPLIALGAKLKLQSIKGNRIVALEDFFVGPGQTVLEADEILCEIQVPNQPPSTGGAYWKLSQRSAVDIAAVGVAASVTLGERGVCHDVKIVLGAVAPTPMRAKRAEEAIKGKRPEDGPISEAVRLAKEEACPISDVRSCSDYRTEMVGVLTRRALRQALERAKPGGERR